MPSGNILLDCFERRGTVTDSTRVQVKSDIWTWAINEAQLDKQELILRYPKIEKWIAGIEFPTFKQLESFACYAKLPFGYMFLKSPPRKNVMEVEFRSINNKLPQISKNLKDTILEMDYRREWMREYRKTLGWSRLEILDDFTRTNLQDIESIALRAKTLLKIQSNWYEETNDYDSALKFLRGHMENVGVLVMQNGVVGMNTHRPLSINEFRAFVLYDEIAPIIFLNGTDTKAGKIFSLIHEYIHFLYQQEDVFVSLDSEDAIENERFINSITAEFLIPSNYLKELWDSKADKILQINRISQVLKVSRYALAIKLKNLSMIDDSVLTQIVLLTQKDLESKVKSSGGDFYKTYFTRNSPTFTKAVINGAETHEISYTYAYKLLGGIKGKTYDNIKEELIRHG